MPNRKLTEEKRKELIENTKKELEETGHVIFGKCVYVSKSGMKRCYEIYLPYQRENDKQLGILNLSYRIAGIIGSSYDEKQGGIAVHGCGFDGLDSIRYDLSRFLYGNGEEYKIKCCHL